VSTYAPSRGMTLREACALVVGMLGRPTAREVHEFLAADGWPASLESTKKALYAIQGGPVEIASRGRRYWRTRPDRWRQSEAGRAWVNGETDRRRCGT
jgi:hypothetical protein